MRNLHDLDRFRDSSPDVIRHYGWAGDDTCGVFILTSPIDGGLMRVIASCGEGWDHVSVSRRNRCPNWPEMAHVKSLFFGEHETVMQLHVPDSDHINLHPNCLHLWRPQDRDIPRPPAFMVGGVPGPVAEEGT